MNKFGHIMVGNVARRAALLWLHEVPEHLELMEKPIADWPEKTYQLAIHIQEAINEAKKTEEYAL